MIEWHLTLRHLSDIKTRRDDALRQISPQNSLRCTGRTLRALGLTRRASDGSGQEPVGRLEPQGHFAVKSVISGTRILKLG
jgi:hypothetical protein